MTVETSAPLLIGRLGGAEIELDALQGTWSEAQYLALTARTNRLLEFTDGEMEDLPVPTSKHQQILLWLYDLLRAYIRPRGGRVLVAPLRLQIRPGKYREPDILLLRDAADPRYQDAYWLGADLVVEVVSADAPERDWVTKVHDYAEAGIAEYWIVDGQRGEIAVLALGDAGYTTHALGRAGGSVTSALLSGLTVDVDDTLVA